MTFRRRDMLLLFALGLVVRGLAMLPVQHPGYMDAAYNYDVALNLARGNGLNEPFLWNYLDDPAGIPHPSHLYWMPLPTVLAWLGITLFGQSYRAAEVPFILLASLLPLVSYWTACHFGGRRFHGWIAGLLTVFSGFFVPYWGHTDNFAPFALVGSLCLIASWRVVAPHPPTPSSRQPRGTAPPSGERALDPPPLHLVERGSGGEVEAEPRSVSNSLGWSLAAGALAGLAHLSRADGLLLLAPVVVFLVWRLRVQTRRSLLGLAGLAAGYVVVMLPWFFRNWVAVGTPLPAAGTATLWMTDYDDLFSFGRDLSLSSYVAWGWGNIALSKLEALGLNLQTVVAVVGMVFLAPLAAVGGWYLRGCGLCRLAGGYGLLLFLAMSLAFTFPGPRGGLFHSSGALLPFVYASALVGLDRVTEWAAARRRAWKATAARRTFGVGLVVLAVLVSALAYYRGVVVSTRWRDSDATYTQLAAWLAERGEMDALVMVNDPPGYWYVCGRSSIVVPNGPPETVLAAADCYGAQYLVLDANRPAPLAESYAGKVTDPRLEEMYAFADGAGQPVVVLRIQR